MNATQLLEHFDHPAEAHDVLPRLRRCILDLALRATGFEILRKIPLAVDAIDTSEIVIPQVVHQSTQFW